MLCNKNPSANAMIVKNGQNCLCAVAAEAASAQHKHDK